MLRLLRQFDERDATRWLERRSRLDVLSLSLLALIPLVAIDLKLGPHVSLNLLELAPVFLIACYGGRTVAYTYSAIAGITVQSYMGQLCFGLIACRRAVPDVGELAAQMRLAFEALRALPLPAGEGAAPAAVASEATAAAKRASRKTVAKPKLTVVPKAPAAAKPATVRRRRAAG